MVKKGDASYTVNIESDERLEMLKKLLDYEAARRGLKKGQAFVKLVFESVDLDSYPEELRSRLSDLEERRRASAAEKAMSLLDA